MRTADFDFELPPELIAQTPTRKRDESRLLVLRRDSGAIEHREFRDLVKYLRPGDVLVLNNSRVIPARLRGKNAKSGGEFELLLLQENSVNDWWAMLRPGKRARIGTQIILTRLGKPTDIRATVLETNDEGHRRLHFSGTENIFQELDAMGEIPLPPYIQREPGRPDSDSARLDRERYQTVFAQPAGSVAAPTAGLHFTESLLDEIRALGADVRFVTLHVGLGTFAPVNTETIAAHTMHEERYELNEETAEAINAAKREGRRVIAVGTTTVRVLESVAFGVPPSGGRPTRPVSTALEGIAELSPEGGTPNVVTAGSGRTRIFIYPPREFKIVDALLTNFHLPCSTLLMLVSAFAAPGETRGREMILAAYAEAARQRYRFFSYGDAMLIV